MADQDKLMKMANMLAQVKQAESLKRIADANDPKKQREEQLKTEKKIAKEKISTAKKLAKSQAREETKARKSERIDAITQEYRQGVMLVGTISFLLGTLLLYGIEESWGLFSTREDIFEVVGYSMFGVVALAFLYFRFEPLTRLVNLIIKIFVFLLVGLPRKLNSLRDKKQED